MGSWVNVSNTAVDLGMGNWVKLRCGIAANNDANGHIQSQAGRTTPIYRLSSGQRCRARFVSDADSYVQGTFYTSELTANGTEQYAETHVADERSGRGISGTVYLQVYQLTPPSTPSSISVPSTIKGGESLTVSWGTGSGATKYYLQRSINGGSYTNIYNGTTRSYSDTALASWNTVSYRVRSYNSDGYSSYRTSSIVNVQNFPEFQMRVNGSLKTSDNGWVKVNGVLKEIDSMWVRVNGTLKEV